VDPLHPLVPIQPAAPTPPTYNRVERVERDHQRDSDPDWGQDQQSRGSRENADQEQFEDDYDPDWGGNAMPEPGYGPDGHLHEAPPAATEHEPAEADEPWDPRVHGERRRYPRAADAGRDGADPGDDEHPGPHIDISA
jgi:hypothetical protein